MTQLKESYNLLDKMLHHSAFKMVKLQLEIAKYETQKHHVQQHSIAIEHPVFITSLPRAGTSVLLNLLADTDQFSYQTYQDMPFLFLPLICGGFSQKFEKKMAKAERAHQDGLQINLHSPEAFEETFFKTFWPQNYQTSTIPIWNTEHNVAFNDFFCEHIQKLLLRDKQRGNLNRTRYISKNNLNINRIHYLSQLFPSATVLIPFRQPLQQAISLLKQHQNFTQQHNKDHFSQSYMAHLGHFDFGENLKPVNFNHWYDQCKYKPDTLNFWLEYWVNAYGYLLENQVATCVFFNFDLLCQSPTESLNSLAEQLKIEPETLLKSVQLIHEIKTHGIELKSINNSLIEKANKIHHQLIVESIK